MFLIVLTTGAPRLGRERERLASTVGPVRIVGSRWISGAKRPASSDWRRSLPAPDAAERILWTLRIALITTLAAHAGRALAPGTRRGCSYDWHELPLVVMISA